MLWLTSAEMGTLADGASADDKVPSQHGRVVRGVPARSATGTPFSWPHSQQLPTPPLSSQSAQRFSTMATRAKDDPASEARPVLTHLQPDGTAHMVRITEKPASNRLAIARGVVRFSNKHPLRLIPASLVKKGDVLATARIAGIMAAKRTAELIPLCHPLALTGVDLAVELVHEKVTEAGRIDCAGGDGRKDRKLENGGVQATARVECYGPTGVEMEAMTAVMGACLTVVDMCKGVDRGMRIEDVRVVLKRGGRSGESREEGFVE